MFYDFLNWNEILYNVNIQDSVLLFVEFLTLCRSDDGVTNSPELVTYKLVNHVVQDCILNVYNEILLFILLKQSQLLEYEKWVGQLVLLRQ